MFSMRRILLFVLIGTAVLGCKQSLLQKSPGFQLQEGDLLFQDLDRGPLSDAIEKVTTGFQGMNLSHVGIVAKDDAGKFVVIEAVSAGVEATPFETFLGRSLDGKRRPKVVVGRLKKPYRHLVPSALKEAFSLKGKPYDKAFVIENDAYYCSELIYEILLRANNGNPVFTLQPMTFKAPDTGETLAVWEEYFSKLGVSIPEGEPGINPGGLSRSPALTIIQPYGNVSRSSLSQRRRYLSLNWHRAFRNSKGRKWEPKTL